MTSDIKQQFESLRADYEKLRWGLVANAGRLSPVRMVRWGHVVEAAGVGSTRAKELCLEAGFDPDEIVGFVQLSVDDSEME